MGKFVDPWSLRKAVKTSILANHPVNCTALNKCLVCLPGQINSWATYTVTTAMRIIHLYMAHTKSHCEMIQTYLMYTEQRSNRDLNFTPAGITQQL